MSRGLFFPKVLDTFSLGTLVYMFALRSLRLTWLAVAAALSCTALGSAQTRADAWENRARQVSCRNYTLITDLPDAQAKDVADNLDQLHDTCTEFFAALRGRIPTGEQVCVFATQEDYNDWVHRRIGANPTGSAGMFVQAGNKRALVAWLGGQPMHRLLGTLRHEGFHHAAALLFPDLPVWANEGIAEMFERAVPVSNGLALGNVRSSDVARLQQAINRNALTPLNDFFRMSSDRWNSQVQRGTASTNYLQAWATVQFLLYGDGGRYKGGFLTFLDGLNRGLSWQQAFAEAYNVRDYAVIQQHFANFVRTMKPTDLEQAVPRMILLAEGVRAMRSQGIQARDEASIVMALKNANFTSTIPDRYGGGTFSARDDDAFELPNQTGGRLFLCDRNGRPLRSNTARPCVIAADLQPRELMLRWKDDDSWELIVDD